MAGLGCQWRTVAQAQRLVARRGGLAQAVTGLLGDPLQAVAFAQRGDVVLVDLGRPHASRQALAVCLGDKLAGPSACGLAMTPMFEPGALPRPLLAWGIAHA